MGRVLVGVGVVLVVAGVAVMGLSRIGLPLGRLPGDLAWRGRNTTVIVPLTTSLLLSGLLTLVLWLIAAFRR